MNFTPTAPSDLQPCLTLDPRPGQLFKVVQHQPEIENLDVAVLARLDQLSKQYPEGCIYVNPRVTVISDQPSSPFFREVKRHQAIWCQQAGKFIPRRIRRKVKNWITDVGPSSNKEHRYLSRAACFIGILMIRRRLVPPHEWKSLQTAPEIPAEQPQQAHPIPSPVLQDFPHSNERDEKQP